jgi:hypothetical protein
MMIHIKVQYDAWSRTFKLMDQDFRTLLEGDAVYDLSIPLDVDDAEIETLATLTSASVAHA